MIFKKASSRKSVRVSKSEIDNVLSQIDIILPQFLNRTKWTLETCKKEAKKYTSRSALKIGSGRAYQAAQRNGWLDETSSGHMKNKK